MYLPPHATFLFKFFAFPYISLKRHFLKDMFYLKDMFHFANVIFNTSLQINDADQLLLYFLKIIYNLGKQLI